MKKERNTKKAKSGCKTRQPLFCQINLYLRFAEIRTCFGIKPINVSPMQNILLI
ncbi:hypothetical protein B4125_3290 [Bacillus paralicheniformis]|nr:hypothetical protein SC10_B2orf06277 [Bacillus paralicheniformis]KUL14359.1 hypothetical protein LI7559_03415 [Bacillus licheniformis LMG 7559]OLG05218.1 hypothetical protein B4125_3290 [Bacillus paralicheniformis]TWJ60144.1 hypothetical protein CHCC5021_3333 [Bacillus paralicheniformis]TWL08458.1 hypothetical protein CHCC19467_3229 [Bacillus paralicheniformis]